MRLSLRWKMVAGYGLLLLLIVIMGWVTLALFSSLRVVQREVFERAIPEQIAVDEIVRAYTAQSAAVRGYLISSQPQLLNQYFAEVQASDEWQSRAQELLRAERERDLLSDLVEAGAEYHGLVEGTVIPLATEGRRSQAFRVLGEDGTPLITRIETLGGQLRQAQDEVVAETEMEVRSRQNQALLILVLVIAAALLLGLALALLLPRRLSRNLDRLVEAARAIEKGDLEQKIDIRTRDEMQELAYRMMEMQRGLRRLQQLALQDRELEIAASIQRNLLQRTIPDPRGAVLYSMQKQANLVGGDWYDLEISGDSLTMVIGDASGKGIGAALMATVTLSSLRAERGLGAGPKRVIERANKALREATEADSFTTIVYLVAELDTGDVRWFNMGHLEPFLLRADAEVATDGGFVGGPRNRALGWFEDPGFDEVSLKLAPGDRLVLYTDGFIEAKDKEGNLFGEERLAEALRRFSGDRAEVLGERLVEEVDRFAGGQLGDDLTLLVLDYRGVEAAPQQPAPPLG